VPEQGRKYTGHHAGPHLPTAAILPFACYRLLDEVDSHRIQLVGAPFERILAFAKLTTGPQQQIALGAARLPGLGGRLQAAADLQECPIRFCQFAQRGQVSISFS